MDDPNGISLADARRLRSVVHRTVENDPIYIVLSKKMCEAYQLCSSCLAAKPVSARAAKTAARAEASADPRRTPITPSSACWPRARDTLTRTFC